MLGIQHEFAGGLVGLTFTGLILFNVIPLPNSYRLFVAAFCFIFAIYGSNLPDIIDPPFSPFHRSIGHNFVSFFGSFFLSVGFISIIVFFSWIERYISFLDFALPFIYSSSLIFCSFFISYFFHLLLDLSTPLGLPLFTGKSILGIIEMPLYLVPFVNIIMLIITIITSLISIKYISKKISGKIAVPLALLPLWGTFGIFGILLIKVNFSIISYAGDLLVVLASIMLFIFVLIGHSIDSSLKKKNNTTFERRYLCKECGSGVDRNEMYCGKCGSKIYIPSEYKLFRD